MKFNPRLKHDLERFKDYVILVEGKKDVRAMKSIGFGKVYAIHQTGIPIRVRIEEIYSEINKKDKICILTDFDKKGKQLYMLIKPILQEQGARLDSSFRGLLLKARISHIEGIASFMEKINEI